MIKKTLKSLLFSLILTGTAFGHDICQSDTAKELIQELKQENENDTEFKNVRCKDGAFILDYELDIPEFKQLNAQQKQEAVSEVKEALQDMLCNEVNTPFQLLDDLHYSVVWNFKLDEQHQISYSVNDIKACPKNK